MNTYAKKVMWVLVDRKKAIVSLAAYMLVILPAVILFNSCDKDNADILPEKVLLFYLGGDNNLSNETYQKIEKILAGWDADLSCRLLIYSDLADAAPSLSEVVGGKGAGRLSILAAYEEENSAGGDVLARVIKDMKSLYPDCRHYGLVVFSHASGWLPAGSLSNSKSGLSAKSILMDGNEEMALADFADAIPDDTFDYIVFEACFSAGIEVAYQLRDKTNYILASSAEIVSPGFTPVYARALGYLFDMERGPEKFAKAAYNYLNAQSGYMRSATFSVIDTRTLEELAAFVRSNCDLSKQVLANEIQHFDRGTARLFCDFEDYYSRLLNTQAQKQHLQSLLGQCITWRVSTPYFMEGYNGFVIDRHSGLTAYIMQNRYPLLNESYTALDWYKASGR